MSDYDLNVPGSWQKYCTRLLMECVEFGAHAGARMWLQKKRGLELVHRVIIADADLSGLDLRGYSFFRSYVTRVNFQKSDLRDCDFRQSIVTDTNASESDISGANFRLADLSNDVVLLEITHDDTLDFGVRSGRFPDRIDVSLREQAENEWRKSSIHRNRSFRGLYKIVVFLTDYGESFVRLAWFVTFILIGFGVVYLTTVTPIAGSPWASAGMALLNSARYFLALSDPYEDRPALLSTIGAIEAAMGYLCLAILVSMIARKILIVR